ncbi:MAG: serine--tRNA ligase [Deltaproteobacteria bacterium]|nr:serine--tRNA ligase [Deltaproteobacteria bacterium]
MLDIKLIRENTEEVRAALLKRMDDVDLDGIIALDEKRRGLVERIDTSRAQRNELAKKIGKLRAQKQDSAELEAEAAALRDAITEAEQGLASAEAELRQRMDELPNMPDDRVPAGGKEANQVVRTWGEKPQLPEGAPDHVALCTKLGLVDYERGVKLGGNGSWIYTGMGAAMEWALLNFFNQEHFADGYTFMLPPHMLLDECGYTAGQFPKFRDDVYHLAVEEGERERFLLPTAETAILNVYRDELIPFEKLPIKAFAYTPCYRREAGSHRSEERGTIRGHQFNKVEMFQFVPPELAEQAFEELVGKTERLVQKLGLHYRTTLLAAKDASASMRMTNDIEVWLPSLGIYKEVSSVSWAGEYQARRASIRFKRAPKGKSEYVHTLNGSGLATSRLFPAIIEQHQQPDGSVRVPEPLQKWLGVEVLKP